MGSTDSMKSSTSSQKNFDAPAEIRKRLKQYKKTVDDAYIQMGRDLYLAYHRRFYQKWGYDTFTDYVEQEVGIAKTRAERLRRIWTKYVKKLKVAPKQLQGVGFTNAFTMLSVVDASNVHSWIERAKTSSWRDLDLAVQVAKSPSGPGIDSMEVATSTGTTIVDDEVVSVDPYDNPDPPSGSDPRRSWNFKLYPSQFKVLDAAISEARRTKPDEMAENEAVAHVATEFLASRMSKEEKPLVRLSFLVSTMERVYGGKFVWIKNDEAAQVLNAAMESNPHLFQEDDA